MTFPAGMDDMADVYTEDATTGAFTTLDRADLSCRLVPIRGGQTAPDRAELAAWRKLLWDEDYDLPEHAQLAVAGERWNVQAGTVAKEKGPGGIVAYRRALIVRAI